MVSPSAASAAMTSETEARRSVAITGAPLSLSTPSMVAVSPSSRMRAPNRASSCTCMQRFSNMVSVVCVVALARVHDAVSCARGSVGSRGSGAADLRTHLVEAVGDVLDLRLARGVFDQGRAVSERRRHQGGVCAAYGDLREHDLAALEAVLGARDRVTAVDLDVRAQAFQR